MSEVLGAYRIIAKLGEGGMGAVYVAEHVQLGRRAAVKVLLPELARDRAMLQRFFTEARAATAVSHPGIVQVFDFGTTAEGVAYIVMELLDGESLTARMRRGVLAPAEAVRVVRQAAGALGAAHRAGVIHRDLKPDNLFLVVDPDMPGGVRVKVLDFGVARLAGGSGSDGLTRTGHLMGTPLYMAPEQSRGAHRVDGRADLYALGCILFELLLGRPPFRYESLGEVIGAHLSEAAPDPRALAPVLPPDLSRLVLRLLAKSPDERPADAAELQRELDALAPLSDTPAATVRPVGEPVMTTLRSGAVEMVPGVPGRRRTWPAVAVASALAVAVVAILVSVVGSPTRAPAVLVAPDAGSAPTRVDAATAAFTADLPRPDAPPAPKPAPPPPARSRAAGKVTPTPPRPTPPPTDDKPAFPPIR